MTLALLRALGFTASKHIPFTSQFRVRCQSCQALVINGVPTHEHGCPDAMHECAGCNTFVPQRQRYCGDCQ